MRGWANQILGIFLLTMMLAKILVVPIIYLDYNLRKDYIATTLCENRDRPQLHCDGKCYLAKRIAQAARQEQKQAESDFMAKLLSTQAPVSDFLTHLLVRQGGFEIMPAAAFHFSDPFNGRNIVLDFFHPPLC